MVVYRRDYIKLRSHYCNTVAYTVNTTVTGDLTENGKCTAKLSPPIQGDTYT